MRKAIVVGALALIAFTAFAQQMGEWGEWYITSTKGNLLDDPVPFVHLLLNRDTGIGYTPHGRGVLILGQPTYVGSHMPDGVRAIMASDRQGRTELPKGELSGSSTILWYGEDARLVLSTIRGSRQVLIRLYKWDGGSVDVGFDTDPDELEAVLAELGWD